MRSLLLMATAIVLLGCASEPKWQWQKDGASQTDFNMDAGACRAQAFSIPGAPFLQVALVYDGCMQGKGWYKAAIPG